MDAEYHPQRLAALRSQHGWKSLSFDVPMKKKNLRFVRGCPVARLDSSRRMTFETPVLSFFTNGWVFLETPKDSKGPLLRRRGLANPPSLIKHGQLGSARSMEVYRDNHRTKWGTSTGFDNRSDGILAMGQDMSRLKNGETTDFHLYVFNINMSLTLQFFVSNR